MGDNKPVNYFKQQVEYLKNNPGGYWFKRKLYGWGWTPATKGGWLTIVIFIALTVWNFRRIDAVSHSVSDTLINFVPETGVLVLVLLLICWKKGEKPRWQWGLPKENGQDKNQDKKI